MQPVESRCGHGLAETSTVDRRVQTDRVDLAELFFVVDLGPAETNQTAVEFEEANALGLNARLRQLVGERLGAEISLIGVPGKRRVVDEAEGLVVLARHERPCRELLDNNGEWASHLVQSPHLSHAMSLGDGGVPRHGGLAPDLQM